MTRYFFDTEFIEDGRTIDLISIGIVCEDGRELYAESTEVDWSKASDWVLENVKPHLWHQLADKREANVWHRDPFHSGGFLPRAQIASEIVRFVDVGVERPEFWADYADYDWVVLCQLFGTMMDLPVGWPMFCMDLRQEVHRLGDPRLPKQTSIEHHALADALWTREAWESLVTT